MADLIFHTGVQLGKCLIVTFRLKDRIVAETLVSARLIKYNSPAYTLERANTFIRNQGYYRTELRFPISRSNPSKLLQQFLKIIPIGSIFSGIPGRIHTGAAIQGVNFQAGIIRQGREPGCLVNISGFLQSIAEIAPAEGKLGILTPGMGAVATTFVAGVIAARNGYAQPTGSLTQLSHIRLGKRDEDRNPLIKDFVPLAGLDDLEFGGWDPYSDDAYTAAMKAGVLDARHLEGIGEELRVVKPMPAVYSPRWVENLPGVDNVQESDGSLMDRAERLMEDIDRFRAEKEVDRLVAIWCGSTEAYEEPSEVHMSLDAFEQGLKDSDESIASSQVYAYACLKMGIPFANGAPNLTVDIPAMLELAALEGVPVAGKDFKTGQTFMKTMLAPGLKARMLGINGWFSTNILGNRDGEVLDNPENFRSKEVSKLGVLEHILQPDVYPDLYGDIYHKVRINYYPPKGDDKEGWDHIDIFGWLGYPMQIKVDFLCKDSILAAPMVLDLALFMDLAARAGKSGIQEWLSFYFKSPQHAESIYPENDLFIQSTKLKNNLRHMMGEDLITHLGTEYYDA